MTRLVASLGWSGNWTVRSDAFGSLKSRRDDRGDLDFRSGDGDVVFRVVRRGRSWFVEGSDDRAEFHSELHADGVRRVWSIKSASFAGTAMERGTKRSFARVLAQASTIGPLHLIVPVSLRITDDAGTAGVVTSRRTLPIGYTAEADERLHPSHLAALTVLIGSAGY
ncbi:hypothetical protein GCM10009551_084640 [Nocardiopsis tropica]|uniref:hypothetical protein n=1 Tax=Tsukamurella TaxID=2060 RepID=UPI001C7CD528|nr:hypothetical protein [Tsukamurella sp. TY48]GIZ98618.1 hypothetical protein TTY48_32300 [Tsukamurella sp. TY48]